MTKPSRVVSVALLLASAHAANAQQIEGSVAVSGGAATDVRGITSHALSLTPRVSIAPDPRARFNVDASVTRFDNHEWSGGAGAGAALRAPIGEHAQFTLDALGNATTTSYDFSYTTAHVLPGIEASAGPLTAYVAAHGAVASRRLVAQSTPPGGILGGRQTPQASAVATSSSARGVVAGASAVLVGSGDEVLRVGVREERGTIDTVPTTDRGVSLSIASGRMLLAGNIGRRAEHSQQATFGAASLSFAVGPAMSFEVAAGSYPLDRLVGTPSGHYLNVGLSLRTGRSLRTSLPTPGAPAASAGTTRLAIRATAASRVELAGDFTNWKTIAAQRASNGVWYVDLHLPPGQYRYAFRIDAGTWSVPEGAAAVDDDFGGKSAWLFVSTPNTTAR